VLKHGTFSGAFGSPSSRLGNGIIGQWDCVSEARFGDKTDGVCDFYPSSKFIWEIKFAFQH
jgi:hypothetical protein